MMAHVRSLHAACGSMCQGQEEWPLCVYNSFSPAPPLSCMQANQQLLLYSRILAGVLPGEEMCDTPIQPQEGQCQRQSDS